MNDRLLGWGIKKVGFLVISIGAERMQCCSTWWKLAWPLPFLHYHQCRVGANAHVKGMDGAVTKLMEFMHTYLAVVLRKRMITRIVQILFRSITLLFDKRKKRTLVQSAAHNLLPQNTCGTRMRSLETFDSSYRSWWSMAYFILSWIRSRFTVDVCRYRFVAEYAPSIASIEIFEKCIILSVRSRTSFALCGIQVWSMTICPAFQNSFYSLFMPNSFFFLAIRDYIFSIWLKHRRCAQSGKIPLMAPASAKSQSVTRTSKICINMLCNCWSVPDIICAFLII